MTLKEFAHKHGFTTDAMAKAWGVSQPFVSRLLRGERQPSPALAVKIAAWSGGEVSAASLNTVLAEFARATLDRAA